MASRDDTVLSQALLLNRSSPVLSQACNTALKFLLNFVACLSFTYDAIVTYYYCHTQESHGDITW